MTKKCLGCGALFQSDDPSKEGYVSEETYETSSICRRCFRIKNYGDYQVINKDNSNYKEIFDKVKTKDNLVLYLCDILNLDSSIKQLNDFKGKVILVITKIDLLPKSVKERKLFEYITSKYNLNIEEIIFVSSNKNYNLDKLMNLILKYKNNNEVYLVGNTNAGKSTLVNAFIRAYSDEKFNITTSALPATTLDIIKLKLNDDITFIDTPGIVSEDNFLLNEKPSVVKNVTPKTEIKPRTYQMKPNQSIIIGNYARIDYLSDTKNSFTLYLSNEIKVNRINLNTNDYLRDLKKHSFELVDNKDIVINGLCFCKITKAAKVDVYVKDKTGVFERGNLI